VPAYFIHRTEAKKKYCEDQLRELAIALETHQRRTGNPAASPKTVVDEGLIGEAYLSCPAAAGKKPAYFHRPGRIIEAKEPTRQVLTCDLGGNHKGGRNVMFANRQCFWYTEREFQDLLNRPENQKFAEALRAAQGP
jgi:hypothetical protein